MYPILLESPGFTLYSYPLFMGLAWGIGYSISKLFFIREKFSENILWQIFLGVFLFAWIGAKVFFLLFSAKDKASTYLTADYFWLGGGFVFYGGLIFGLLFFFFYTIVLKKFPIEKSYLFIPALAFGHGVGRVGCFLTGCCFGSQTHLPWASHIEGIARHPVQLYEAFALFFLGFVSLKLIKSKRWQHQLVNFYLLSYGVIRFTLEFFRGDEIRGIYALNLSTSQWVSIGLILASALFMIKEKSLKRLF